MDQYTFILLVGGSAVIFSCLVALFWFGGFLLPLIYGGGPFVPSSNKIVKQMIDLAHITGDDRVADLGSGDGRMLIAAAQAGAKSVVGYEIHPGLVVVSRLWARKKKLQGKIQTIKQSFWKADVHDVTVVLLYQLPDSMTKLGDKLKDELPSGARIVSHAFPITNWEPVSHVGKLYLYKKP